MLALDRAIVARFRGIAFTPAIATLCDGNVPTGTRKPYAVMYWLDLGGPANTFKDQDGILLTVEHQTLQFTLIAYGKDTAGALLEQLDAAFNARPLTVGAAKATPVRSSPLIVLDTGKVEADPVDRTAKAVYQAVVRYIVDFDLLTPTA
jgi:hypothetical protein